MIHSKTRSIVQIIPGFSFKTAGSDRAQKFLLRVTTLLFIMIPPLIQWMLKKTTVCRILLRFFLYHVRYRYRTLFPSFLYQVCDDPDLWDVEEGGLYPTIARISHSVSPNATWSYTLPTIR